MQLLDTIILIYCGIAGSLVAYYILKPKPNAIVLEKIGENYHLSKSFCNESYLQHNKATYPIPSTYEYWVLLGKGFRLKPRWYRFFYIQNSMLAKIEENSEKIEAKPALDPQTITQFVRSQTIAQILRGMTVSKTQILLNLILGLAAGLMLGIFLTKMFFGG